MRLNTVKIPIDYMNTRVIHNHQIEYIIGMSDAFRGPDSHVK